MSCPELALDRSTVTAPHPLAAAATRRPGASLDPEAMEPEAIEPVAETTASASEALAAIASTYEDARAGDLQ